MRFTLISPRLAIQKGDLLGSGVPYWPIELAILAAFLRRRGESVTVVDLFGSGPRALEDRGDHYLQGARLPATVDDADVFVVFAISYMSHSEIRELLTTLRRRHPGRRIAVLENSQAVTGYALNAVAGELLDAGADALLCGDVYGNWEEIAGFLEGRGPAPGNVLTAAKGPAFATSRVVGTEVSLPVPAWELFPLESYWKLPYSHGPKTKRFFPLLTSRGCPFPCDFCVVPETNAGRWRARKPEEVVDEMAELQRRFGVSDFQIEDLNPTIRADRMDRICRLLIERRLGVRFGIVSGTKAETVRLDQLPRYAEAGCRYLSISPETGSRSVLAAIGKPFDFEHGARLVRECRRLGIATQACFLVGHPAETAEDHRQSVAYLRRLVRAGLDEAAIFIVAPYAGSALERRGKIATADRSRLVSFSPKGRESWKELRARRSQLLRTFFVEKLRRGPDLWLQGLRSIAGIPRTKMENLPRRVLHLLTLLARRHARG